MSNKLRYHVLLAVIAFIAVGFVFFGGCSKKKKTPFWFPPKPAPAPVPVIENINSVSDPRTIVGVSIEINGTGFGALPGLVTFSQNTNVAEVTPDNSGWCDTSIAVAVPASGSENAFEVPGILEVCVITAGGNSNIIDLELVQIPSFNPSNLAWDNTATPLPEAKTGLKAATIRAGDNSAYMYVSGGQTDAANSREVLFVTHDVDNTNFILGGSWVATSPLPVPRAFHAMVSADSASSQVAAGEAFVYVIGGQENSSDTPGGTANVYYAPVNPDGTLGNWSETSALPDARLGHTAAVTKGNIYVMGGLDTDGNPTDAVFVAPINPDGSLGSFSTASTSMPVAVGFHASFAFAGKLYVLGGLNGSSTDPNDYTVGSATHDTYFASLSGWDIEQFTPTTTLNKARKKHVAMNAFGQIIIGEGIYSGGPTVTEMWVTFINEDGTLDDWNALTNFNAPNAAVFNCAAAVSPIYPENGGPRFFLIGGMNKSGVRQSAVYMNTAP